MHVYNLTWRPHPILYIHSNLSNNRPAWYNLQEVNKSFDDAKQKIASTLICQLILQAISSVLQWAPIGNRGFMHN